MTRISIGPAKVAAKTFDTTHIHLQRWVKMCECTFEKQIGLKRRKAVPRPKDEHHIFVVFFCVSRKMCISKANPRTASPVSEQASFYVAGPQFSAHHIIVAQKNLRSGQVIYRAQILAHRVFFVIVHANA